MSKRALIIGAGIGGLCAAIALRKVGYPAVVFERSRKIRAVPAGMTLWSNALYALQQMGLRDELIRLGSVIDVVDCKTSLGEHLNNLAVGAMGHRLGTPSLCIHRGDFHQVLLSMVPTENLRTDMQCVGFSQDAHGVTAVFENGSRVTGSVLIACDGIQSLVRSGLLGPSEPRYAGYTCYRGVVSLLHRMLPPGLALIAMGRGREFGLFPCGVGRFYWFATHNQPPRTPDSLRGRKNDCCLSFADFSEPVVRVLHATPEPAILRHDVYDRLSVPKPSFSRIALLGDAAHPMTPNLGQGGCLAIEDAVVLARCLRDQTDDLAALRDYAELRHRRTAHLAEQSYLTGQVLTLENGVLTWFRDRLLLSERGEHRTETSFEGILSYRVPTLDA